MGLKLHALVQGLRATWVLGPKALQTAFRVTVTQQCEHANFTELNT